MKTTETSWTKWQQKTSMKETLKGLAHVGLMAGGYCAVFGILMYPVIDAARRAG